MINSLLSLARTTRIAMPLALLTGLLVLLGCWVGNSDALALVLGLALLLDCGADRFSDWLVLRLAGAHDRRVAEALGLQRRRRPTGVIAPSRRPWPCWPVRSPGLR